VFLPAPFPDAHDAPPPGWTGHVFKLSQNYPTSKPAKEAPWESFDFKTQPDAYVRAVLSYALEGNTNVNWDVDQNSIRKWYHAPWLDAGPSGREFIRGMTHERTSQPGELYPIPNTKFTNWAVGMYNPLGGYILGRVWNAAGGPDATKAKFPNGTVAIKLLFTTATKNQVPFLHDSLEWTADIHRDPNKLETLRLLQIDVAVRDTRNASRTGWVFGTFIYNGDAPGTTVWDRMVPVGLMWGNDPTVTETDVSSGTKTLKQTWLNPTAKPLMQHYGWADRLNGPVDNKISSCLSCHSTAQLPAITLNNALPSGTEAQRLHWFRNIKSGKPFNPGGQSLDYSLQLAVGLKNFQDSPGR
jgi:hypothetical protein